MRTAESGRAKLGRVGALIPATDARACKLHEKYRRSPAMPLKYQMKPASLLGSDRNIRKPFESTQKSGAGTRSSRLVAARSTITLIAPHAPQRNPVLIPSDAMRASRRSGHEKTRRASRVEAHSCHLPNL